MVEASQVGELVVVSVDGRAPKSGLVGASRAGGSLSHGARPQGDR